MGVLPKPTEPPKDELGKKENNCPWCNYEGEGQDGEKHVKVKDKYFTRNIGNGHTQCDNCGKTFETSLISKPWSIEVERGSLWTRENRIKELGGK